jgi:hypothetical protein
MQMVLISYLANPLGHNDIMFLEITLVSKLGILFIFAVIPLPSPPVPSPNAQ